MGGEEEEGSGKGEGGRGGGVRERVGGKGEGGRGGGGMERVGDISPFLILESGRGGVVLAQD